YLKHELLAVALGEGAVGDVLIEDRAQDSGSATTTPREPMKGRTNAFERRRFVAHRGLEGALHDVSRADRAQVDQRPLHGGDGDSFDNGDVLIRQRERLVHDERRTPGAVPTRARDLMEPSITTGEVHQCRGRTVRRDCARATGPAGRKQLALPRSRRADNG